MKICFRADGGINTGMGHIMRTLVLAEEFRSRECEVFYACRYDEFNKEVYEPGVKKVLENGFDVIRINEKTYLNDLANIEADCLITDSYDVNEHYFNIVKEHFKFSGCIDDNMICSYFNVDFLVNQNIYARKLNYKVNKDTLMLLGLDHVLLRKEFREIPSKVINNEINRVMITVGGSDDRNLTGKIIDELKDLKSITFNVVIGSAFKYIDSLKKYEGENIVFYYNPAMSELMKECDAAISACGSTLYELAACGTPTIGIVIAENQESLAKNMDKLGIIKYSTINQIRQNIMFLDYQKRKAMNSISKKCIDGLGAKRIVNNILLNIMRD